jgi:hypothetical protein
MCEFILIALILASIAVGYSIAIGLLIFFEKQIFEFFDLAASGFSNVFLLFKSVLLRR